MIVYLLLILTFINVSYSFSLKAADNNKLDSYKIDKDFKLPEGPIFARGWLKFSNFDKTIPFKPNDFIKNSAFSEQFKENAVINLRAEDNVNFILY